MEGQTEKNQKRFRWSIRRKVFLILLVILTFNVVILVLMGSTLFEGFYVHNKVSELKSAAHTLQRTYSGNPQSPEGLFEQIERVENRNSIIALVSLDGAGEPQIGYFTRDRRWGRAEGTAPQAGETASQADENASRGDETTPAEEANPPGRDGAENRARDEGARWHSFDLPPPPALDEELLAALPQLREDEMRVDDGGGREGFRISLVARLDDNFFLYIETPKSYIRSTADLAVRYTAYLSAGILLAGAVALYLLAGRITRPIGSIQRTADKIARLDFSETCPVRSNDELGALSRSINNMSAELQANIDKLIAANEVLQSDLTRQQQTDRMRRQFIANVSHDFKTPLTLIVSYAEALETAADGERRAEYRQIIIDEGNRLSQMVGSILELSQFESGTQTLAPSIFCISEVVDSVAAAHKILAARRALRVSRQIEEDLIVRADFGKIVRVASNLYENAVKYAPEGGELCVRCKRAGEKCEVSVWNSGPGIAEGELENLFVSFYRSDRSRHRDGKSYGLGLAIVKAIMDSHGEDCGCRNEDGGVSFWFTLPLCDIEETEEDGAGESGGAGI